MLSGDYQRVAAAVADSVRIGQATDGLLLGDKVDAINGRTTTEGIAMVGDGV